MIHEEVIAEYDPAPTILYRAERYAGQGSFARARWEPINSVPSTDEQAEREIAKRHANAGDRTRVLKLTFTHGEPEVPQHRPEPQNVKEALDDLRVVKRPTQAHEQFMRLDDLG
jgi:hypothetical protein